MSSFSRYSRQIRFAAIGEEGQRRLQASTAAVVGCGALGSVVAEIIARAGVGRLILVDRDLVEESNLQRQFLYAAQDALEGTPKAEAARRRLEAVNPGVRVEAQVASLTAQNAGTLLGEAQVLLDGTDNFPTRYLLNDLSIAWGIPWVYGAAVGSYGLTMTIVPRESACLRCVFPEAPPPEQTPTCETAGVIAPITTAIGAVEAAEALKILSGHPEQVSRDLLSLDLWGGPIHSLRPERRTDCPACGERKKPETLAPAANVPAAKVPGTFFSAESLCGRNAVQITPAGPARCDLEAEGRRLSALAEIVSSNKFLLRVRADGREASLFPDGRVIVWETTDVEEASGFYARLFGGSGT